MNTLHVPLSRPWPSLFAAQRNKGSINNALLPIRTSVETRERHESCRAISYLTRADNRSHVEVN